MTEGRIEYFGGIIAVILGCWAVYDLVVFWPKGPVVSVVNAAVTGALAIGVHLGSQWYGARKRVSREST